MLSSSPSAVFKVVLSVRLSGQNVEAHSNIFSQYDLDEIWLFPVLKVYFASTVSDFRMIAKLNYFLTFDNIFWLN